MNDLLMKDVEFNFDEHCLESFQKNLKEALVFALIMQHIDWSVPFEIICDACDYTIDAVFEKNKDKKYACYVLCEQDLG